MPSRTSSAGSSGICTSPGDDVGFWLGAICDRDDAEYAELRDAVRSPRVFAIELLYSDH
jgi:hypothetical protein